MMDRGVGVDTLETATGWSKLDGLCAAVRIALDTAIHSGDSVEVFTAKVPSAGPSRDWLQFAQTPRARAKIRQWFSRERREDAIDAGREELVKALRKESLPIQTASKPGP